MRKFKKFLAAAMTGAMMLGLVATTTPAVSTYANTDVKLETSKSTVFQEAAKLPRTSTNSAITVATPGAITITINYDTYTATLTSESQDTYAFVDVYKSKKKGQVVNVDWDGKPSSYSYKFDGNTVSIDLSFLKATSLQGIKVVGDKSMVENQVKINAQPAKLKSLKYEGGKFTQKVGSTTTDLVLGNYQYRGQYASVWTELSEFDSTDHTAAGTTIVIREKVNGAPAGPEAKVKIKKAAAGPKVTIDYLKDSINLKKTSEISVDGEDFKGEVKDAKGELVTIESLSGKVTPQMIRDTFSKDGQTAFTVFVRTKATEGNKPKPASSVVRLVIPAITTIDVDTVSLPVSASAITVVRDGDAKITAGTDSKGAKYEFKAENGGFDYKVGAGNWKSVKANGAFKVPLTSSPQTLSIRKSGTKYNKNTSGSADAFPSKEVTITIPAKAAN